MYFLSQISTYNPYIYIHTSFPNGLVVKNLPASAGDTGDKGYVPGLGRSLGEGNVNPLQYSFLENSMDRGAWWDMTHHICTHAYINTCIHIYV